MYEIFEMLCKQKGVTPYRVCKDTGLTTATISNWKAGRYVPKQDKMQLIADYFSVSIKYLMTGKEEDDGDTMIQSRDLKKKYQEIHDLLKSGETAPLYFDGQPADPESIDLLLKQVEISLALIEKREE